MAKRGHKPGVPRPDQVPSMTPEENASMITGMFGLAKQPRCDMTDPDAVAERYDWYIEYCVVNGLRPSVASMALAFGYERTYLLRMKDGVIKSIPEASCNTLKRAWDMLTALMEEYMLTGKINPVPGIFLLKNNHGYRDQTETVVVKKDPYESGDPEEIARRYLSGMAPALDAPQETAPEKPVVETVVVDQSGTVE